MTVAELTTIMDRLRRREKRALAMWRKGAGWEEIGRANGTSADTARRDVERARETRHYGRNYGA